MERPTLKKEPEQNGFTLDRWLPIELFSACHIVMNVETGRTRYLLASIRGALPQGPVAQ